MPAFAGPMLVLLGTNKRRSGSSGPATMKAPRTTATPIEPITFPFADVPSPLLAADLDHRYAIASRHLADRLQGRAHVRVLVRVSLAEIGVDRIDNHEPNIAPLLNRRFQQDQIGLQIEHAVALAVGLPNRRDDVNALQIGAGRHQSRNDRVRGVILLADKMMALPSGARPSPLGQSPPVVTAATRKAESWAFPKAWLAGNHRLLSDGDLIAPEPIDRFRLNIRRALDERARLDALRRFQRYSRHPFRASNNVLLQLDRAAQLEEIGAALLRRQLWK